MLVAELDLVSLGDAASRGLARVDQDGRKLHSKPDPGIVRIAAVHRPVRRRRKDPQPTALRRWVGMRERYNGAAIGARAFRHQLDLSARSWKLHRVELDQRFVE